MTDAPKPGTWVSRVTGGEKGMFGRLHQNANYGETIKQNFKWEGNKLAFAGRGIGVTAGVAIAANGIFNGKTADGEDRSLLSRGAQVLFGTVVAGTSLLAGKGRV